MTARAMLLIAALAACLGITSHQQDNPKPDQAAIPLEQIMQMVGGGAAGGPGSETAFPKFDKVTKGMTSREGLFTLWSYPPGAKDKDSEKLLAQIPVGLLGERFMLSTSISGGGFLTGFPLDQRVVQWELLDRQLVLVEPESHYVVDSAKEVSDVVRRTYPERIRAAVPIVTKTPSGDPLIDLGPWLKSSFADIAWMTFMGPGGARPSGGINSRLSKWTKKKTFELNTEIGVELAISQFSPPGSYEKKLVHYSFWRLPESDYRPRVADDRVGYFLTAHQDWAKPTGERDIFDRYVDRWHLVKRDPSLELCEPKQPIVFYIEKTVPVRFRRAVRDGIREWNKAFEKIGFVNAVEVRQQTDDNEWKDLDPEDMRYSFFRWIVTGAGFAMGPHRANPYTGQIYDADIIFDDAMVRFYQQSAEQWLPSAALARKFDDPARQAFVEKFPQFRRPTRDWDHFAFSNGKEAELRRLVKERLRERGRYVCEYTEGMKHQVSLAHTMLTGQPPKVIEKFLYEIVKEVVMHEVGHTLGLRHNFKASTVYSLEEIQKRRGTGEPMTGSVMDYNPVLFFAANPAEGRFVTPTLGPYDEWAIEYGYRPFDGSLKGEKEDDGAEEESDEKTAEAEPQAAPAAPPGKALANLDKLPPEVREQIMAMISKLPAEGGAAAASPQTVQKKPSAPKIKAPVAGEKGMLLAIASRAAEPELAYATDEDASFLGSDPRVNLFDSGADPIEWARTRMELVDKRMENILDWAVKEEESWYYLQQSFLTLVIEKVFVLDYVGRYVGGIYFNRGHRGDPNATPPFEVVSAERQRAAMAFIEDNLFTEKFFKFSPELLRHLAPPRWWHQGATTSYALDFPIHDLIGVMQWWNLVDRLYPDVLRRIHDAELQTTGDKFTAAEYIQRLSRACWSDAVNAKRLGGKQWTDAKPFLSDIRRSLQREYLGVVEPLVRSRPGSFLSPDLQAMVKHSLRKLADDLDKVIVTGQADFASQAHLTACKSRIDRMLAPQLRELGG